MYLGVGLTLGRPPEGATGIPSAPTLSSVAINGHDADLVGDQRSMVTNFLYTFNRAVKLDAGAVTVALVDNDPPNEWYVGTVPTVVLTAIDADDNGYANQWVATFTGAGVVGGSIEDGVYTISLDETKVHSTAGQALAAGNDTEFYRFYGDVAGTDMALDITDFGLYTTASGSSRGDANFVKGLDYDNDGSIAGTEATQILARFGHSLLE